VELFFQTSLCVTSSPSAQTDADHVDFTPSPDREHPESTDLDTGDPWLHARSRLHNSHSLHLNDDDNDVDTGLHSELRAGRH